MAARTRSMVSRVRAHRTCHEVESVGSGISPLQPRAVAVGLTAAIFADVVLGLALQPAFHVPRRLTMADEIDERTRHAGRSNR